MTIIAGLLIAALIAQQFMHLREREKNAVERAKLLDRIQFPEVRQVEAGEPTSYEAPKDEAELAYVGQEVPEFINVGGPADA